MFTMFQHILPLTLMVGFHKLFKKVCAVCFYFQRNFGSNTLTSYSPMIPSIFGSQNRARCIEELKKLRPYVMFRNVTAPAAVLIPLCIVKNVPAIMFLRRTMRLRTHPGEIGWVL